MFLYTMFKIDTFICQKLHVGYKVDTELRNLCVCNIKKASDILLFTLVTRMDR